MKQLWEALQDSDVKEGLKQYGDYEENEHVACSVHDREFAFSLLANTSYDRKDWMIAPPAWWHTAQSLLFLIMRTHFADRIH